MDRFQTEPTPTVLVIEDDPTTRKFLAAELQADGFELLLAGTVAEARRILSLRAPDVVCADLQLPDGTGLDVLRSIRTGQDTSRMLDRRTPVLVLSGRAQETDRLRGFDRGCDDYLAKPFSYPELRARLRVLLRRTRHGATEGLIHVGGLEIDATAHTVRLHGDAVDLTPLEFSLLATLALQPERVHTKQELLRNVWGYKSEGQTRTLDSHACRLRRKLGVRGETYVVNVWGVGYRLCDLEAVAA